MTSMRPTPDAYNKPFSRTRTPSSFRSFVGVDLLPSALALVGRWLGDGSIHA